MLDDECLSVEAGSLLEGLLELPGLVLDGACDGVWEGLLVEAGSLLSGLVLEGACDGLLGGSLVDPGLVLAELGALSEGFGLDDGLVLAGGSLWVGLVEAEGVTLGAFVVSDCLADVVGADELGLLLGVVL